jgi:tetratricopeptide (TPR) repeat protein
MTEARCAALGLCLLIAAAAPVHSEDAEVRALVKGSFAALHRGSVEADPERKLAAYRDGVSRAEEAIRLDDTDADAHYALFCNLGRVTELGGTLRQALNLPHLRGELDRALQLNPHHTEALAAKGEMLWHLPRLLGGDLHEAEDYARRAVVSDPTYWHAHLLLAHVLIAQSRPDAARAELTTVLARISPEQPERSEALELLGELNDTRPAPNPVKAGSTGN